MARTRKEKKATEVKSKEKEVTKREKIEKKEERRR